MEPVCSTCQKTFISENEDFKTLQYYRMCVACRSRTTNIDDCINYEKFNQLISNLNESVETNKQIVKNVEGERGSITYLIQQMNHNLIKLKIKSDAVVDVDIQSEIIRLNDKVKNLELLLNSRFSRIEISINELMKTLLQKL